MTEASEIRDFERGKISGGWHRASERKDVSNPEDESVPSLRSSCRILGGDGEGWKTVRMTYLGIGTYWGSSGQWREERPDNRPRLLSVFRFY